MVGITRSKIISYIYIHIHAELDTHTTYHNLPEKKTSDPSKASSTRGANSSSSAPANTADTADATGGWGAANDRANEIWQAPKVVGMRDHEIVNLI